jgi:hypothetical protein
MVIKSIIFAVGVVLCISLLLWSSAGGKPTRGDGPVCQEGCLQEHTQKMKKFSEDLARTGDRIAYQDQVEQAEKGYAQCLTNCRELIPVK